MTGQEKISSLISGTKESSVCFPFLWKETWSEVAENGG